jgi:CheY-like chemotaxis protein
MRILPDTEMASEVAPSGPRRGVLLAHGDAELRRLISQALGSDGFEVTETTDGIGLLGHLTLETDAASVRALLAAALRYDQGTDAGCLDDRHRDTVGALASARTVRDGKGANFAVMVAASCRPGIIDMTVLALLRCAQGNIPVVILTSFGDRPAPIPKSGDLGIVAVFDKPIDLDELCAVVRHAVSY